MSEYQPRDSDGKWISPQHQAGRNGSGGGAICVGGATAQKVITLRGLSPLGPGLKVATPAGRNETHVTGTSFAAALVARQAARLNDLIDEITTGQMDRCSPRLAYANQLASPPVPLRNCMFRHPRWCYPEAGYASRPPIGRNHSRRSNRPAPNAGTGKDVASGQGSDMNIRVKCHEQAGGPHGGRAVDFAVAVSLWVAPTINGDVYSQVRDHRVAARVAVRTFLGNEALRATNRDPAIVRQIENRQVSVAGSCSRSRDPTVLSNSVAESHE